MLLDIDADRLALVERLGRRLAAEAGADLRLSATLDLAAALDGAGAVLAAFRPGGVSRPARFALQAGLPDPEYARHSKACLR